jgi:hypothetical protein
MCSYAPKHFYNVTKLNTLWKQTAYSYLQKILKFCALSRNTTQPLPAISTVLVSIFTAVTLLRLTAFSSRLWQRFC